MVLITGATGFIGSALMRRLVLQGESAIVAAVRRPQCDLPKGVRIVQVGDLLPDSRWQDALQSVKVVVHAAARVHVMNDTIGDPLAEFRRVNVLGTLNLARQAAEAGVARLVFISSIKVNGEMTLPGRAFQPHDDPAPVDPYGISKMEAELGLRDLAAQTGMEVVIVRPPLVYGPGVKANFRSMMYWLRRGVPLPLGAIDNRRSLVALDNLVDLIVRCMSHPAAANETFLASDGEDVSTTQLLRRLARALRVRARLVPIAPTVLQFGAALVGRRDIAQRLCDSLQVDISQTTGMLGWAPPVSLDKALQQAADGFLRESSL